MKKHRIVKAGLALVLLIAVAISSVSISFAGTQSSLDQELIEKGYPQYFLNRLSENEKIKYRNNVFISGTAQYFTETGESYKLNFVPNEETAVPFGAIKDTSFELILINSGEGNNIRVDMKYKWLKDPYNRYQDAVGFSWNPAVARVVPGSFKAVDYYRQNKISNQIKVTTQNFSSVFENGCGYYADLKNGIGVTELHGTATFLLEKLTPSADSQMYVSYFHKLTLVSLTLNIGGIGSIGVTQDSGYDSRATAANFKW